jgi:hypothetical protein
LRFPTAEKYKPRLTILKIPDTLIHVNSATQKQRKVPIKVIITDKTVSLMIFFIQKLTITPKTSPSKGPPNDTLTKLAITPVTVVSSPLTRLIKSIKKTIAVPSFKSDYPSTRILNLTLAPNYLSRATTATGSVAESTHPSAQA